MSSTISAHTQSGLRAIYIHLLAELLDARGVDASALLIQSGLDSASLQTADARVPLVKASDFLRRAMAAAGDPGLGLAMAECMHFPLHGPVGAAVMSSQTLGQAMEVVGRYLALCAPLLTIRTRRDGNEAVIRFTMTLDLGPLTGFVLDTVMVNCLLMGQQLLGCVVEGLVMRRRGAMPEHYRRLEYRVPVTFQFQQAADEIRFPVHWLEAPVRCSDELAARISREQCEQALRRLSEDAGMSTRVRRVIDTAHPFPPRLQDVASTLFVSERTLKRRLQDEQSSYQLLVDEIRYRRAMDLLRKTSLDLARIADMLGYADPANFTRAFKRWSGMSPRSYRNTPEFLAEAV